MGLQTILLFLLRESHPLKDLFISEGEVPFHLLPQLQNVFCQQVWVTSSRQIILLCPLLEGPGICHHFSMGISLMSPHAKIELAGGINFHLQRHGSAGGAWRAASLEPNSHNCHGSPKDALTSLASFLASSFPGTADSSIYHSGVSHLSTFHGTHRPKSKIAGSRGIFSPLSSEVSGDLCRKEATISSVLAVPPSQSLCLQIPLHLVVSWGWQIG